MVFIQGEGKVQGQEQNNNYAGHALRQGRTGRQQARHKAIDPCEEENVDSRRNLGISHSPSC